MQRQAADLAAPVAHATAEVPYLEWLARYFPQATSYPMSPRHTRLWDWGEALTPGIAPRARVDVWPRGGGKSTTGELITCRVGAKLTRQFVLWVNETQPQADKHVQAIATRFEALGIGRSVGKYGNSKGWRREELRTDNGFSVAAIGLDTAARGVKLDDFRPDLIIFDDIDSRHDTPAAIQKKIESITTSLLPTGSGDCAVLFLQNLIHANSIVSQLVDGRADFLKGREVIGPEPAVRDLAYEQVIDENGLPVYQITGGTPTWAGQDLETCQRQMNTWGRPAFLRESQHRVQEEEGGLWSRTRDIDPYRRASYPTLVRVGVGVDPSTTETGDAAGLILAGIALENGQWHGYILDDKTMNATPSGWANAAVTLAKPYPGARIVAESNQGGVMVENTLKTVAGCPPVELIHVHDGKLVRADPVQKLYEDGRVHHVGAFPALEAELCGYHKGDPSPNRLDALVLILTQLLLGLPAPPLAQTFAAPKATPLYVVR